MTSGCGDRHRILNKIKLRRVGFHYKYRSADPAVSPRV